jgi:hypothetical protein
MRRGVDEPPLGALHGSPERVPDLAARNLAVADETGENRPTVRTDQEEHADRWQARTW